MRSSLFGTALNQNFSFLNMLKLIPQKRKPSLSKIVCNTFILALTMLRSKFFTFSPIMFEDPQKRFFYNPFAIPPSIDDVAVALGVMLFTSAAVIKL